MCATHRLGESFCSCPRPDRKVNPRPQVKKCRKSAGSRVQSASTPYGWFTDTFVHVTAAARSRQGTHTQRRSGTASLLAPLRPAHLLACPGLQHGGAQPIQPTHGRAVPSCRREDGVGLMLGTDLQPRGNTGTQDLGSAGRGGKDAPGTQALKVRAADSTRGATAPPTPHRQAVLPHATV